MKLFFKKNYWIFLAALLLSSCTAHKKISYLTDADTITAEEFEAAALNYEATIMPKDVLSITVNTPSGSAAGDFNLPLVPPEMTISTTGTLQNYIVDSDGYIVFPTLGKIKVGSLTKKQIEEYIYAEIYPKYLKEKPIVNVRFTNYRVVVMGEVSIPGIYPSANGQITILDALAAAGDLTIYGRRDNILLIREDEKGMRSVRRINLQDKSILLDNDTYYLKQNDKIYVQPNKARGNSSQIGSAETLLLSGVSLLLSVIAIIIR